MKSFFLALAICAAITKMDAQNIIYSENFEGPADEIFDAGWEVVDLFGADPDAGIFNEHQLMTAMGFNGKTMGASTFQVIGTTVVHNEDTDVAIVSPVLGLPAGQKSLSYRVGSVGLSGIRLGNYSVHILTASQYGMLTTHELLKDYMDAHSPADTETIAGDSNVITINMADYPAGDYVYIFRVHNSIESTFVLFDDLTVKADVLATPDYDIAAFELYPNPARDQIRVAAASGTQLTGLIITDMYGRICVQKKLDNVMQADISLGHLSAGTYLVSGTTEKGSITKKLVIAQ